MKKVGGAYGFFFFTFLWTWVFWLIPGLSGWGIDESGTRFCIAFGGIAPSSVAIIMALRKNDSEYRRDFFGRIINFKLIKTEGYIFIALIIPVTAVLSIAVLTVFQGRLPEMETLRGFILQPARIFPLLLFMMVFGPIPEEIGWRGYALDHIDRSNSLAVSSLIIGFFWALWHLPLFFINGSYQNGLAQSSAMMPMVFIAQIFAHSVIMTWIYKKNGRSILAGILYHFAINFFGELIDLPDSAWSIQTGLLIIGALFILTRQRSMKNQ